MQPAQKRKDEEEKELPDVNAAEAISRLPGVAINRSGGEGSKVMVLVYNLPHPEEIYRRFAGVQGAAYLVGGVSVQFQKSDDIVLAPIRSGVGLRLGANVGYLKYSRRPTWNPF